MGSVWAPEPAAPSVPFSFILSSALCTACRTKRQSVTDEPGVAGVGDGYVRYGEAKRGRQSVTVAQHSIEGGIIVEVQRQGHCSWVCCLEFQELSDSDGAERGCEILLSSAWQGVEHLGHPALRAGSLPQFPPTVPSHSSLPEHLDLLPLLY